MPKIRSALLALGVLLALTAPVSAEVDIRIGVPQIDLRFRLPIFPELVLLPGLPVYFAPRVEANYFFYDGLYWVYSDDAWYASDWFDGPWWLVDPEEIPLFILRIPVRYYRYPPSYFRGWSTHEPPRWGHRWGRDWDRRHRDWQHWDRRASPAPAPLPTYQRDYSGKHYPRDDNRRHLRDRHYRYQPRDPVVRERIQPRLDRDRREPRVESPGRERRPQESPRALPHRRGPEDLRSPSQRPESDQRGPERMERRPTRGEEREDRPRLRGEGRRPAERGPERGDSRGRGQERERRYDED